MVWSPDYADRVMVKAAMGDSTLGERTRLLTETKVSSNLTPPAMDMHMVIFRSGEEPGYYQAENVDDAIRHVERLRNTRGVTDVRIFQMSEVEFDFQPYYQVSLRGVPQATAPPAPTADDGRKPFGKR